MSQSSSKRSVLSANVKAAGALLALLTFGGANALAQEDIYTDYASEKGGCTGSGNTLISLAKNAISGPGFSCILSNSAPAGTGLSNFDGACVVDGQQVSDFVTLDLGNYPDRFAVAIPARDGWLSMYPCTPVEQLKN